MNCRSEPISSDRGGYVKIAVLTGSLFAGALTAVLLRLRNRTYRRLHEAETVDADHDGVPDVYETT